MPLSRRRFLHRSGLALIGAAGAPSALSALLAGCRSAPEGSGGPIEDPQGLIDLPEGFTYRVFSRTGEEMDDGYLVPAMHDGMAAFAGEGDTCVLVRNHEVRMGRQEQGPFGTRSERLRPEDRSRVYDPGTAGHPAPGGTTTLVFDTRRGELLRHHLSLAGTVRNCAGGITPWNSWITCEETERLSGDVLARDHGYAFDVPADPALGLVDARPLRAMGRFYREAVALDPGSGCVYQTEDLGDGLLYRFVSDTPGNLTAGRLQALAVEGLPGADLRNWEGSRYRVGARLPATWVDLDDPENRGNDLRLRGHAAGAALFARGEGMWTLADGIYIACTNGGRTRTGQIWRYTPGEDEGRESPGGTSGTVSLFAEPNDPERMDACDNLTATPWGDLLVCEDSGGVQDLVRITPAGETRRFARNRLNDSEFAGACFSPDGSTMFVNIQDPGLTLAVSGPWPQS